MEPVFAIVVGLFFAVAVYLILSKFIIRVLLASRSSAMRSICCSSPPAA